REPVHGGDVRLRHSRHVPGASIGSRAADRSGHDHRHRVDEGLRRPHRDHRGRTPVTWELRWHPFRGEWVLFTAHRGARPWIGETIIDDEPEVREDNALAPRGRRIATTNPDYRGVFVFTNDLPVFSPDAPTPSTD